MKRIITLLVLLWLCTTYTSAQKQIGIGMTIGLASHGGDAASWGRHGLSFFNNTKLAYGLNASYIINDDWGLRLQYRGTEIEGDDSDLENKSEWGPQHLRRDYMYRSQLSEIGILVERKFPNLFGNKNRALDQGHSKLYPFVTGGIAYAFIDDDESIRDWGDPASNRLSDVLLDQSEGSVGGIQFPVGLGFRYDISQHINVDLFYNFRLPVSDYIDGISESANPDKNDAYQICGLNIGLRFNNESEDRDQDGIADKDDECPDRAGSKLLFGCPDADNDGIMDDFDNCPTEAGSAKNFGCPPSTSNPNKLEE
ncbi:outer membrane beta-barrel protein [Saprospiraceae bacterium]|nr:outer membrane beta-barrel protein [Saprospiraceae bacterium]